MTRRVAIVHDWLINYGGAERVLERILKDFFPEADLFTVVDLLPAGQREFVLGKPSQTTFIQRLPFVRSAYRSYLPLMPLAVEQLDLSGYDVVVSSSHAVAKGVLTGPNQLHICMCYTPIRYAWDLHASYLRDLPLGTLRGVLARISLHYIRMWDVRTSNGVDEFIAISKFVASRIKRYYGRDSVVIYPPVDVHAFPVGVNDRQDYYVTASRLVPYKRVDLLVESFRYLPSKRLVIIGDGPELKSLQDRAPDNVSFLGFQPHECLTLYLQRARAFLFAAVEDFGIAPVEAQACGTPVIALAQGASLETVRAGVSGLFFNDPTPDSIVSAIQQFEEVRDQFEPESIRSQALRFSHERFADEFSRLLRKHGIR